MIAIFNMSFLVFKIVLYVYIGFSKLLNFLQGLIFVVDSNDRERIQEAAEELQKMVNIDTFRNTIVKLICHVFGCLSASPRDLGF